MGDVLYVGTSELRLFKSFQVEVDREKGTRDFRVEYQYSHDPETQLKIEEEKRMLTAAGWKVS